MYIMQMQKQQLKEMSSIRVSTKMKSRLAIYFTKLYYDRTLNIWIKYKTAV